MDKNILSAILTSADSEDTISEVLKWNKKDIDEAYATGFEKGNEKGKADSEIVKKSLVTVREISMYAAIPIVIIWLLWWTFSCIGDNIREGWRENTSDLHACQRGDTQGCLYGVSRENEDSDRITLLKSSYLLATNKPLPSSDGKTIAETPKAVNGITFKAINNGVELDTDHNIITVHKDDSQFSITPGGQ